MSRGEQNPRVNQRAGATDSRHWAVHAYGVFHDHDRSDVGIHVVDINFASGNGEGRSDRKVQDRQPGGGYKLEPSHGGSPCEKRSGLRYNENAIAPARRPSARRGRPRSAGLSAGEGPCLAVRPHRPLLFKGEESVPVYSCFCPVSFRHC